MINLSDISFRYDTKYVLKAVNLTIKTGDRIGLIGGNGTGKTTLCHIIMGLIKPESGTVTIFGKRRQTESDFAPAHKRECGLFPKKRSWSGSRSGNSGFRSHPP